MPPIVNLVSFAAMKMTPTEKAYLKIILANAKLEVGFDKWASKLEIEKNNNTVTAYAMRYRELKPATTPLAEQDGTLNRIKEKMQRDKIPVSVDFYGSAMAFTDRVILLDFDSNITTEMQMKIKNQAFLTRDIIIATAISNGTNVMFADGAISKASVASGQTRITTDDLKMLNIKLERQKAKKEFGKVDPTTNVSTVGLTDKFLLLASFAVIEDLRELPGWKDTSEYNAMTWNEEGSIGKFRVVKMDNIVVEDIGGRNVYSVLAVGKGAYATSKLESEEEIKIIIKDIGSAGTGDALNEIGSVGWKGLMGAGITNQAHIVCIKTTASMEDNAPQHFIQD